jgi:hypothetical protein
MVIHQTPGLAKPIKLRYHLPECLQERNPVFVIFEDSLAPVATRGAVIQGVWVLNANGARHRGAEWQNLC